jgi:hypothetical protein
LPIEKGRVSWRVAIVWIAGVAVLGYSYQWLYDMTGPVWTCVIGGGYAVALRFAALRWGLRSEGE